MLGVPGRRVIIGVACLAALGAGCSNGSRLTPAAKSYADAIATASATTWKTATVAQRTCMAEALVLAVGVPSLQAQGVTPEKIRNSSTVLAAIKPTDAQTADYATRAQRCNAGAVVAPVIASQLFRTQHPGRTHCLAEALDSELAAKPLFVYADMHRVLAQDAARPAAEVVDRCFDLAQAVVDDSTLIGGLTDAERACVINEERNSGIFVEALVSQLTGKPLPLGPENPFKVVLRHCGVSQARIDAATTGF